MAKSIMYGVLYVWQEILMVAFLAAFWHHRHWYPIKHKRPLLAFLSMAVLPVILIPVVLQPFEALKGTPCVLLDFIMLTGGGMFMDLLILRVFNFYVTYQISQHTAARASAGSRTKSGKGSSLGKTISGAFSGSLFKTASKNLTSGSSSVDAVKPQKIAKTDLNWLFKRTYLVRNRFSLRILACEIVYVLCLIVVMGIMWSDYFGSTLDNNEQFNCHYGHPDREGIYQLMSNIPNLMKLILGTYLAVKTKVARDSVGLKQEFSRMLALILVLLVINAAWTDMTNQLAAFLRLSLSIWSLFSLVIILPLVKARQHGNLLDGAHENDKNVMFQPVERFLGSVEARKLFGKFLATQFAQENLVFWEAVMNFRKTHRHEKAGSSMMWLHALPIYRQHLQTSSPMTVNLPSEILKPLLKIFAHLPKEIPEFLDDEPEPEDPELLKQVSWDMFETARKNIGHLMQYDSVPRFCANSSQNKELWEQFREGEVEEAAMAESSAAHSSADLPSTETPNAL